MRTSQLPIFMAVVLAGCASDEVEPPADPVERGRSPHVRRHAWRALAQDLVPHQHPERWPFRISSPRIVVHYKAAGEQAMAQEVLGHVEHAWQVQINLGGALPPLDDHGAAGPDGRFDVYLQRGEGEPYVVDVAPNDATWYDDRATSMVLYPWGEYGGAKLEATVFHELRHASQARHDWWEHAHAFEADATLWEVAYYGFEASPLAWQDYQDRPEWSLFRDGYQTWYMYGGALFLLFLSEHVFDGGLGFSNEMWRRSRNAPGADVDPALNEPDFVDALQTMLAAKGRSVFGEVLRFARARWYTGERANGSLPGGAALPEVAHRKHARKAGAKRTRFAVSPQLLGTSYVLVERATTDPATLWVSLETTSGAKLVVQAVGGDAADATLDLSAGPARVRFGAGHEVTLVVTALPADGAFDPDLVGNTAMKASLTLSTTR